MLQVNRWPDEPPHLLLLPVLSVSNAHLPGMTIITNGQDNVPTLTDLNGSSHVCMHLSRDLKDKFKDLLENCNVQCMYFMCIAMACRALTILNVVSVTFVFNQE